MTRLPLPGSARVLNDLLDDPDPLEVLRVTLYLRPAKPLDEAQLLALGALPPAQKVHRSAAELGAAHRPTPEDLAAVAAFAQAHGLRIMEILEGQRKVRLEGAADAVATAFGLTWGSVRHVEARHRVPVGELTLPAALAGRVAGVLGLDARPKLRPHVTHRALEDLHLSSEGGFTVPELASLYGFPEGTGQGQRIGIIELGGGYAAEDLAAFFASLDLPVPKLRDVSVDRAKNDPAAPLKERLEVTLDLQVAGAAAPEAEFAVYFAPNTDQGFMEAIHAALNDPLGAPSVISVSWGSIENAWPPLDLLLFDAELKQAAAQGVTILASSGDTGSKDNASDGKAHVNFPASSAWVLGCGGTTLEARDGKPAERVWNSAKPIPGATGGGVSEAFPLPDYQKSAKVPPSVNGGNSGRGVPDVAANADMATGYRVYFDGKWVVLGGTSAVAPLWAGLIARCNERLKASCGFLHPLLYAHPEAFRPISKGSNPDYHATGAYSACTGLGTPDGEALLKVLGGER